MRKIILAVVIMLSLYGLFPSSSSAFGMLRMIFDGIANQVGLDRGTIPKVLPRENPQPVNPLGVPEPKNPESRSPYIRAEGF